MTGFGGDCGRAADSAYVQGREERQGTMVVGVGRDGSMSVDQDSEKEAPSGLIAPRAVTTTRRLGSIKAIYRSGSPRIYMKR